jgi:stearoyl-CoA desaturase (delta-9 desaturase)
LISWERLLGRRSLFDRTIITPSVRALSQRPIPITRACHTVWTGLLFAIIAASAVIIVPAFGYIYGYTALDWALFVSLYIITGLGITVGYHRFATHRSFDCPNGVKVLLLIAGGWALQNTVLKWSADHLRHHAQCDQPGDPYNAQRGFWHSHCGWLFVNDRYTDEKYALRLRQDPIVMWQSRYYVPIVLSGLAFPFLAGLLVNGWMGGISCFLLAGVGRTFAVLNSTFCINSVCHLWGSQPHSDSNSSRNNWWISLVTFGEGYHNYHHTYPSDYRNGSRWYSFDPSKWLIFSLSKIGLARSLRTASTT